MSSPLPQLVANRYRLISPLGQGGMGRVWKAQDEVLHRTVAIKELVPPPGLTDEERREMRERSLREARAIARLNNINVVRIFDVLRTDGDPWIVMEYVASRSLQDTLAQDGPVSPQQAVEIGLGVLGALKAAHKAGVMHRDVKPGNVLLGEDGRVVLTDFGLATVPGDPNVTRTGLVLGSPAYIAPERARDGTAGPEGDLWSLGATIYAAVEGKSPYARSSAIGTLAALATEAPPPPRNAGPLKAVLNGLLVKDPTQRIDAATAERLLRKAAGRRSRGISLLDGVRRPGPNGPREPRQPVVPAPRPAQSQPTSKRVPPVAASAAPVVPPAAPAHVDPPTQRVADASDAAPTTRVGSTSGAAASTDAAPSADPTTKLNAAPADDTGADPTSKVETSQDVEPTTRVDPSTSGSTSTAGSTTEPDDGESPAADEAEQQAEAAEPKTAVAGTTGAGAGAGAGAGQSVPVEQAVPAELAPAEREPERRPTPTAVMPAVVPDSGSVSGVTSGRASVPPAEPRKPTSPERKRRLVLIGGLVAVLLITLAVVVPLLNRGDGDETGQQAGATSAAPQSPGGQPTSAPAAPPAQPSATPSVTPSPTAPALPAGWILHKDPTGFSVPIPPGMKFNRRERTGSHREDYRVYFSDGKGRMLLVDQTRRPLKDAKADWEEQERNRKSRYANYKKVTIEEVDYWDEAADWEWTMTDNGRALHVRNRGFVTAPTKGYAIRWDTPAAEWAKNEPVFKIIADGFVPVRK